MKRHALPDPHSRSQVLRARRKYAEQVMLTAVYTVVLLWAVVAVVALVDDDGVLAVAASLVLSAVLVGLWDTWRAVLRFGRALQAWLPEEVPVAEEELEPERPKSLQRT